jgi:hypothetical protein
MAETSRDFLTIQCRINCSTVKFCSKATSLFQCISKRSPHDIAESWLWDWSITERGHIYSILDRLIHASEYHQPSFHHTDLHRQKSNFDLSHQLTALQILHNVRIYDPSGRRNLRISVSSKLRSAWSPGPLCTTFRWHFRSQLGIIIETRGTTTSCPKQILSRSSDLLL